MANISAIKLPDNSTYDIKDNNAARGNAGIFYGTCATAADTAIKAVTCTEFTASNLKPGAVINVYFSVTNSAAVANLQLNVNGTGAKPIKYIYNGSYSTIPGAAYIKLNQIYQFTYDGTNWIVQMIYNTNSDTTYCLYYSTPKAGPGGIFPYTLILPLPDGRYSSVVTSSGTGTSKSRNTNGFLPSMVFYYPINRTLTEDTTNSNDYLKESSSLIDLRYSGNKGTTLTSKTSVYLVGSIGTDGLFYLDSDWITQTIPTSANGKVYLFLGEAFDTYRIDLDAYNPMFKYTNGAFRQISIDSITTNGHTVNADVPANAVFTDTVTTATTTGSGNAVTSITASNGALTVTKGTTFLTSHQDISGKADKATTLAGYGITDAKIASGVITLGSNTITPLTSSSTLNAAKLSGAIPSAVTATTQTAGDNSTKIATTAFVSSAISTLGSVLNYKGTKATVSALPTSGNTTGDVWHVTANSGEYAWDGTEWQELGTAISIPANTGNSTTGISIAAHGTGTVIGVQSSTTTVRGVKTGTNSLVTASHVTNGSNGTAPTLGTAISLIGVQSSTTSVRGVKTGTNSTTTASKVSFGTAFSVPNVTGATDVTVPIRADADVTVPVAASAATTVPIKATSATTVPIKNTSATTVPVVSSNTDATLSFTMDTTDTKKLKISWSATPTRTVFGTSASIYGVQSSTTSVTGVQSSTTSVTGVSGSTTVRGVKTGTSSTTTASKVTLGTALSIPNPSATDVTVPIRADADTTVPIKNASATSIPNVTSAGTASTWTFENVDVPIRADADTTVPIKNASASTFVTGTTHTVTDNGHTHTI